MRARKSKLFITILFSSVLSVFIFSCKNGITEPQPSVLTKDTIQKLQAAADKEMMNTQTPGLMAYISVEGEGELYIIRGVSNLVTSEPMKAENFWRIGSVTKTITSEAVLILADEGKIDLNKPISFYLPELNIPSGDKITIPMLANMTSGLNEYANDDLVNALLISNGQKVFDPAQLLVGALAHPLQFEPGSQYNYCNTNYLLLGELIKKVTGKTVIEVLNEKVFQPLGMKNTFWPNTSYLPFPYSHGYFINDGSLLDVTNWNPSWGGAAGILTSNIFDLKIWVREMVEAKLLSAKMKGVRFTWVDSDIPGLTSSGFGLEKYADWIGHPGSIIGYNTQVYYNTVNKISIIIYTNSLDGYPAATVLIDFANILSPLK
jgi:D-alanyl-D-alanine carboxypeptidase